VVYHEPDDPWCEVNESTRRLGDMPRSEKTTRAEQKLKSKRTRNDRTRGVLVGREGYLNLPSVVKIK
jgi:hypothetical protein